MAACGQEEEDGGEFPGFPHKSGARKKVTSSYICSEYRVFLKVSASLMYLYVILHHNDLLTSPLGCSVAQMMVWFLCGTLELPGETLLHYIITNNGQKSFSFVCSVNCILPGMKIISNVFSLTRLKKK